MILKDFFSWRIQHERPQLMQHMVELMGQFYDMSHKGVLDFGCGSGKAAELILQQYPDAKVWQADIKDQRKIVHPQAQFVKISADNPEMVEFQDASLDVIFASFVLEHVNNLTWTIREFHRILKPKGIIVLSIPNFLHLQCLIHYYVLGNIYRYTGTVFNTSHRNFVPPQFLKNFVKDLFILEHEEGNYWSLPIPFIKFKGQHAYWVRETRKFNKWLSFDYIAVYRKR